MSNTDKLTILHPYVSCSNRRERGKMEGRSGIKNRKEGRLRGGEWSSVETINF
jgi:hypothetical protein